MGYDDAPAIMSFFSNTKETSDRYATYAGEFHELFQNHALSFGRPENLLQLGPKLEHDEQFCADFSTLAKSVAQREEGRLTLTRMLTIVAVAIGGPEVMSFRTSGTVPVVTFLKGIGGWSEIEEETEPIAQSKWVTHSPETRRLFGSNASHDPADEEHAARQHGWLSGGPQGDHKEPEPPMTTRPTLMDTLSRLERALQAHPSGIDRQTEQIEPHVIEPHVIDAHLDDLTAKMNSAVEVAPKNGEIKTVESSSSAPLPEVIAGPATAAPKAAHVNAPKAPAKEAKEDELKLAGASAMAALAEIAGKVARTRDRRLLVLLAMVAILILTLPGVVGVLLYREFAGNTPEPPEGALANTAPAGADVARDAGSPSPGVGTADAKPGSQPRVGNKGEKTLSGLERRQGEVVIRPARSKTPPTIAETVSKMSAPTPKGAVELGSGMTILGGTKRSQIVTVPTNLGNGMTVLGAVGPNQMRLDQAGQIPKLVTEPAKIHTASVEPPPTIAETVSEMSAATPQSELERRSWMTLGETERRQIVLQEAGVIPWLETTPARIHPARPEPPPTIAETVSAMSAGMPEFGNTRQVQVREIPWLETTPPKIQPYKPETPPTVAGLEPAMREDMPAPVTTAKAAPVSVVGGASPGRGVAPALKPPVLHPNVKVSAGTLSTYLVKSPVPGYPRAARKQKLQGDVLVRVLISEKGKIERAVALNGPPSLRGAVEKAVRHWRYKPFVLNGKAVEVQTWVTFHFTLEPS